MQPFERQLQERLPMMAKVLVFFPSLNGSSIETGKSAPYVCQGKLLQPAKCNHLHSCWHQLHQARDELITLRKVPSKRPTAIPPKMYLGRYRCLFVLFLAL